MTKTRCRRPREQIIRKLDEGHRQIVAGKELGEVCGHMEIAESAWHRWLAQYGGMEANGAERLRELEVETTRLNKLLANLVLDIDMLKEIAKGGILTPNCRRSAKRMLRARFGVSARGCSALVGQHRST